MENLSIIRANVECCRRRFLEESDQSKRRVRALMLAAAQTQLSVIDRSQSETNPERPCGEPAPRGR